jgi:preprotein translocase subunit SecG
MYYVLVFLHIFVSISMIGIVLLQSGKGAEMGASFGAGGSQTVFGASGGNTFMNRLTTAAAVLFMLTSLTLAHLSSTGSSSSIMPTKSAPAAPAQMPASAPATPAAP